MHLITPEYFIIYLKFVYQSDSGNETMYETLTEQIH